MLTMGNMWLQQIETNVQSSPHSNNGGWPTSKLMSRLLILAFWKQSNQLCHE